MEGSSESSQQRDDTHSVMALAYLPSIIEGRLVVPESLALPRETIEESSAELLAAVHQMESSKEVGEMDELKQFIAEFKTKELRETVNSAALDPTIVRALLENQDVQKYFVRKCHTRVHRRGCLNLNEKVYLTVVKGKEFYEYLKDLLADLRYLWEEFKHADIAKKLWGMEFVPENIANFVMSLLWVIKRCLEKLGIWGPSIPDSYCFMEQGLVYN